MQSRVLLCLLVACTTIAGHRLHVGEDGKFTIYKSDGSPLHSGSLGHHLQGQGIDCASGNEGDICRRWDDVTLRVTAADHCHDMSLTNEEDSNAVLSNCIALTDHWYGGPEQVRQYWPTEEDTFANYSYVTKQQDNQALAERYWLASSGVYYYVSPETPLFIDQNNIAQNQLCLIAQNRAPYSSERNGTELKFSLCAMDNVRSAHEHAVNNFLGKPTGIPDERMVRYPIWSTWVKYKANINQETVLDFANNILNNGFQNSQLEIDDRWETCYGSLTFDTDRFPDIKAFTDLLKTKGFRVTLWIHPFINQNCEPYHSEALEKGYFVKDNSGNTALQWWNGAGSVIDFTNPEAANWWVNRLKAMQEEAGIDSLKFDAGESSFEPQLPVLTGDISLQPNIFTTKYVETVSQFGPIIEVRVGQRTQHLPHFVRMLDKDTKWDFNNGLPTLITTLLEMNMVGYPLVLPDMVGGNVYGSDVLTKELFIRWLQATVFMPAIQYSVGPWDFDDETVEICRRYTELHANYTDTILELMNKTVQDGSPLNPPVWWIDPENTDAHGINDEFLLGEDILVAPVVKEGAVSRDIYLPAGTWRDELRPDQPLIQGRTWLRDYPAALNELPYFTRVQQ